MRPPRDQIQRVYALTRWPVVIGEFHFGAAERAAAQPEVIGSHYFQLCDQSVTGRFDGENYSGTCRLHRSGGSRGESQIEFRASYHG